MIANCRAPGASLRYTLIEMMVAFTIFLIAAAATIAAATGGLNVYDRARNYRTQETDMLLALERLERDVRNCYQIDTLRFEGRIDSMACPALVRTVERGGRIRTEPGKVRYFVDGREQALVREEFGYAQATAEKYRGRGERTRLATGVAGMTLRYHAFDPETAQFVWVQTWQEREELPLAVKITLKTDERDPAAPSYSRTIFMPAAQLQMR